MLLAAPANAKPIAGRDVMIGTPDGKADGYFVAPATGKSPGVLIWPDIMGLRPAFRQMADRLAQSGYAVLVVNQFYRSVKAPFLAPGESYDQPEVRAKIGPYVKALSPEGHGTRCARLHRIPRCAETGRQEARPGQHRLLHGRADGVPHGGCKPGRGSRRARRSTAAGWSVRSRTAQTC